MIQPDEIIRSNRKTLSLSVDAHGRLVVRAPMKCTKERIFAFIEEKEDWIIKKQSQRKKVGITLPPENLNGYSFLLLGQLTKIYLIPEKKIGYDKENHRLYLPQSNPKRYLVKWLKENAKRIFTNVTMEEAERMGVTCRNVSVSSARKRWGSCSGRDDIRYTFRLLYCPREIIQYVVVHELAHTRHKNHSARFWQEVEKYIPDWKSRRAWLKLRGALLDIF